MDIGMTSMPATTTGLQLLFEDAHGVFDDRFNRSTSHLGNLASSVSRSYHYRFSHVTRDADDGTSSFGGTDSDCCDCFCTIRKDAHDVAPVWGEMDLRVRAPRPQLMPTPNQTKKQCFACVAGYFLHKNDYAQCKKGRTLALLQTRIPCDSP